VNLSGQPWVNGTPDTTPCCEPGHTRSLSAAGVRWLFNLKLWVVIAR
jgi:hypothetical protein